MLVYRDLISKLAKDLFFHINVSTFIKEYAVLLMCASLIVPNSRDNVLAKILWC